MTDRAMLFSRPDLVRRGWTDTAIRKFLPAQPDDTRDNPYYSRAGAPMKFWLTSRVEEVESTNAFLAWRAGVDARRARSRQGVLTRSENMVLRMEAADVQIVRGRTFAEIHDLARATHGGNYQGDPGPFIWSMRAGRNAIRHSLTNYESLWSLCNRGDTGRDAYETLRDRVEELIDDAYPDFSDEERWETAEGQRGTREDQRLRAGGCEGCEPAPGVTRTADPGALQPPRTGSRQVGGHSRATRRSRTARASLGTDPRARAGPRPRA